MGRKSKQRNKPLINIEKPSDETVAWGALMTFAALPAFIQGV